MITMKVDLGKKVEKFASGDFTKVMDNAMTKLGLEAERTAKKEAPVDTGTLRRSIGMQKPKPDTVNITGAEHWVYAQYGTSAHDIEGNPWLYWDGADHPVHKVHHPGTTANPFVTRTANYISTKMDSIFYDELRANGYV